jgi:hypothetical protein
MLGLVWVTHELSEGDAHNFEKSFLRGSMKAVVSKIIEGVEPLMSLVTHNWILENREVGISR